MSELTVQAQTFFSLSPSYLVAGETLTITPDALPQALLTDEPLTLDLVEVDEAGQDPQPVARFKVQVREEGFRQLRRVELPSDQPGDYEAAQPRADVSKQGHTLPFETTWKRAELVLTFAGLDEQHRVVVRTPRAEGDVVFELGVQVKTQAGDLVYDSGEQFVTLDAWNAMIHNCAAAAKTQLEGHHYLVEQHGAGDYFGSESGQGGGGRQITDCTTFCKQVLQRAYAELGAPEETRLFAKAHLSGSHFAQAARQAGWSLVYCLGDKDSHDSVPKDAQDPYWRICQRALTDGVFKTFGAEGVICNETLDEVVCGYDGGGADPSASARYDDYAQAEFFLVALSLGDHMSMKVGPEQVYECHWSSGPRDSNLFDRSSQTWATLKSYGYFYLVVPPPYLDLESFPGLTADERRAQLAPGWDTICQYTGDWRPSDTPTDWGDDEPWDAPAEGDDWGDPPPDDSGGGDDDGWGDPPPDGGGDGQPDGGGG